MSRRRNTTAHQIFKDRSKPPATLRVCQNLTYARPSGVLSRMRGSETRLDSSRCEFGTLRSGRHTPKSCTSQEVVTQQCSVHTEHSPYRAVLYGERERESRERKREREREREGERKRERENVQLPVDLINEEFIVVKVRIKNTLVGFTSSLCDINMSASL